jgi:hypothetical protein
MDKEIMKKQLKKIVDRMEGKREDTEETKKLRKEFRDSIDERLKDSDCAMLLTENEVSGYGSNLEFLSLLTTGVKNFIDNSGIPKEVILQSINEIATISTEQLTENAIKFLDKIGGE